ncbi:MAG: phage portal protein [Ruminiclostridium sp.]|nr:phage portal protein [Ruminiclostridium sp.]MBQ9932849.1 phage portal protein [Ruminiclostridium sp.]
MPLFKRDRREEVRPAVVQLRQTDRHPFRLMDGYIPLHQPEFSLYRSIREAIPVVDAAILKLVRLTGGVEVSCQDKRAERELNQFLRTVPAGWNQQGIQAFLDGYLDCLLTCGRAVGEIVPSRDGREIAAVLCGNVSDIEVKEEGNPLDILLALRRPDGTTQVLPRQDLLLFTPYSPSPENPYGVSLLHSMPFLSGILLKIYQTLGANWERAGNLRFAVVYKPGEEGLDSRRLQERSELLAQRWSQAMESTRSGAVRDFVATGDVEIKVIGAEAAIPDCQAPVRLIIEQIIAQTGIPPFLLGLNWSSTERMSSQQADIMTSELTALRRTLTPVVEKICRLWLRMHGYDTPFAVEWEEINLQDQVEEARAELFRQQAAKLERGEESPHPLPAATPSPQGEG